MWLIELIKGLLAINERNFIVCLLSRTFNASFVIMAYNWLISTIKCQLSCYLIFTFIYHYWGLFC